MTYAPNLNAQLTAIGSALGSDITSGKVESINTDSVSAFALGWGGGGTEGEIKTIGSQTFKLTGSTWHLQHATATPTPVTISTPTATPTPAPATTPIPTPTPTPVTIATPTPVTSQTAAEVTLQGKVTAIINDALEGLVNIKNADGTASQQKMAVLPDGRIYNDQGVRIYDPSDSGVNTISAAVASDVQKLFSAAALSQAVSAAIPAVAQTTTPADEHETTSSPVSTVGNDSVDTILQGNKTWDQLTGVEQKALSDYFGDNPEAVSQMKSITNPAVEYMLGLGSDNTDPASITRGLQFGYAPDPDGLGWVRVSAQSIQAQGGLNVDEMNNTDFLNYAATHSVGELTAGQQTRAQNLISQPNTVLPPITLGSYLAHLMNLGDQTKNQDEQTNILAAQAAKDQGLVIKTVTGANAQGENVEVNAAVPVDAASNLNPDDATLNTAEHVRQNAEEGVTRIEDDGYIHIFHISVSGQPGAWSLKDGQKKTDPETSLTSTSADGEWKLDAVQTRSVPLNGGNIHQRYDAVTKEWSDSPRTGDTQMANGIAQIYQDGIWTNLSLSSPLTVGAKIPYEFTDNKNITYTVTLTTNAAGEAQGELMVDGQKIVIRYGKTAIQNADGSFTPFFGLPWELTSNINASLPKNTTVNGVITHTQLYASLLDGQTFILGIGDYEQRMDNATIVTDNQGTILTASAAGPFGTTQTMYHLGNFWLRETKYTGAPTSIPSNLDATLFDSDGNVYMSTVAGGQAGNTKTLISNFQVVLDANGKPSQVNITTAGSGQVALKVGGSSNTGSAISNAESSIVIPVNVGNARGNYLIVQNNQIIATVNEAGHQAFLYAQDNQLAGATITQAGNDLYKITVGSGSTQKQTFFDTKGLVKDTTPFSSVTDIQDGVAVVTGIDGSNAITYGLNNRLNNATFVKDASGAILTAIGTDKDGNQVALQRFGSSWAQVKSGSNTTTLYGAGGSIVELSEFTAEKDAQGKVISITGTAPSGQVITLKAGTVAVSVNSNPSAVTLTKVSGASGSNEYVVTGSSGEYLGIVNQGGYNAWNYAQQNNLSGFNLTDEGNGIVAGTWNDSSGNTKLSFFNEQGQVTDGLVYFAPSAKDEVVASAKTAPMIYMGGSVFVGGAAAATELNNSFSASTSGGTIASIGGFFINDQILDAWLESINKDGVPASAPQAFDIMIKAGMIQGTAGNYDWTTKANETPGGFIFGQASAVPHELVHLENSQNQKAMFDYLDSLTLQQKIEGFLFLQGSGYIRTASDPGNPGGYNTFADELKAYASQAGFRDEMGIFDLSSAQAASPQNITDLVEQIQNFYKQAVGGNLNNESVKLDMEVFNDDATGAQATGTLTWKDSSGKENVRYLAISLPPGSKISDMSSLDNFTFSVPTENGALEIINKGGVSFTMARDEQTGIMKLSDVLIGENLLDNPELIMNVEGYGNVTIIKDSGVGIADDGSTVPWDDVMAGTPVSIRETNKDLYGIMDDILVTAENHNALGVTQSLIGSTINITIKNATITYDLTTHISKITYVDPVTKENMVTQIMSDKSKQVYTTSPSINESGIYNGTILKEVDSKNQPTGVTITNYEDGKTVKSDGQGHTIEFFADGSTLAFSASDGLTVAKAPDGRITFWVDGNGVHTPGETRYDVSISGQAGSAFDQGLRDRGIDPQVFSQGNTDQFEQAWYNSGGTREDFYH